MCILLNMKNEVFLSIIIPSYNEERNLERKVLDTVIEYLAKQTYQWEVILSDDGSSDSTLAKLEVFAQKHARVKLLKNPHRGKAATVAAGMLLANGQWRLFTDFDQSTPLSEIEKLLPYTKQNYAIVIGSREMIGAQRDKEPWYRHLMGRVFNLVVQILTVPGLLDTQCGFKLFSSKATQTLFPKLIVYGNQQKRQDAFTGAFDVELLFVANKLGFAIREVPIHWAHYQTNRVSPLKDSLRMFRDIALIRSAFLQGKYKIKLD